MRISQIQLHSKLLAIFVVVAALFRTTTAAEIVRGLPEHALAALPQTVQLAVLLDNAAQLRTTEGGQKMWSIVSSTGFFAQIEQSWPTLAKDLELTPQQAFDELLGRRAIIASNSTFEDKSQWVLITHVTTAIEQSLRNRLRPAARELVQGFPILSVGGGKYELATSTITTDDNTEKLSIIILSPGGTPLFDEVLKSFGSSTAADQVLPVPKLKGRVDVMMLMRNAETSRRTLIAATIGMRSWDLEFASDNSQGIPVSTLPAAITQRLFANSADICFAAATATGASKSASGLEMFDQVLWTLLPLDKAIQESFASGAALSISPAKSVSWALPLQDSKSAAANTDSYISTLFASIDRAGPSFRGEAPTAIRTYQTHLSVANPLARLLEPNTTVQWQTQTASDNRTWWIATCGDFADSPAATRSNCVYHFMMRPQAAITALSSAQMLESAPISALKQIRLIEFSAFANPELGASWCNGSGRVELVP